MRVLNLSDHEKVICKNSDADYSASVETVINSEQSLEPGEMSAKDQHKFGVSVKKWEAGLGAPERIKTKKLLKRYACVFVTSNK